jgi:predicted ATPase
VLIAVAGAHRVGKTTLVDALAAALPGYAVVPEPYDLLVEDGYEVADPPAAEDYEAMLRRSIAAIATTPNDAIVDRSPLDLVAYRRAVDADFELDDWLDDLSEAMDNIDLVVFVPIEEPDRVVVGASEDRRLRRRVDAALRALLFDDPDELVGDVIEVEGDVDRRVAQVLRELRRP